MSWKPDKWRHEYITGKQEDYIEAIEKELEKPFTGSNRGEASDYIEKYGLEFHESKQKKRVGRAPKWNPKTAIRKDRGEFTMTLQTALELATNIGQVTLKKPFPHVGKDGSTKDLPIHITIEPEDPMQGKGSIEIDGFDNLVKYIEEVAEIEFECAKELGMVVTDDKT